MESPAPPPPTRPPLGSAVARDFCVLNRELVVVRQLLPHCNVPLGVHNNVLLALGQNDLGVAVGLRREGGRRSRLVSIQRSHAHTHTHTQEKKQKQKTSVVAARACLQSFVFVRVRAYGWQGKVEDPKRELYWTVPLPYL